MGRLITRAVAYYLTTECSVLPSNIKEQWVTHRLYPWLFPDLFSSLTEFHLQLHSPATPCFPSRSMTGTEVTKLRARFPKSLSSFRIIPLKESIRNDICKRLKISYLVCVKASKLFQSLNRCGYCQSPSAEGAWMKLHCTTVNGDISISSFVYCFKHPTRFFHICTKLLTVSLKG